jgi:hypothetical protein
MIHGKPINFIPRFRDQFNRCVNHVTFFGNCVTSVLPYLCLFADQFHFIDDGIEWLKARNNKVN